MSFIIDLSTLLSGFGLIFVGIVLLIRWSQQNKEILFYWGFGLCLWGASHIINFARNIQLLGTSQTIVFVQLFLIGLAFTFFLLYGTLLLILKKKQANIIVIVYFLVFFIVNVLLAGMTESIVLLSVWHNILFITPPALVFGVYYYYHFRQFKTTQLWLMYNLWIFFAILAFAYTFLFSLGFANPLSLSIWQALQNLAIVILAYTYLIFLFKEHEAWSRVTKAADYVIDDELKTFFEEYFFDRAEEIIKEEMKNLGVSHLRAASRYVRQVFIDECIKNHFSKIVSLQKQEIIRAKLVSILDIRLDMTESGNSGIDLGRY